MDNTHYQVSESIYAADENVAVNGVFFPTVAIPPQAPETTAVFQ